MCPTSSATNVMDFSYDISTDSNSGARRDAYLILNVYGTLLARSAIKKATHSEWVGRSSGASVKLFKGFCVRSGSSQTTRFHTLRWTTKTKEHLCKLPWECF